MPCIDDLGNICNYKVNLQFYAIATPSVSMFTSLKNAQRVYGQYGICISMNTGQSVFLSPVDQARLSNIEGDCEFDLTSDEQRDLHALRDNYVAHPYDIRVYFVNEITETAAFKYRKLNGCGGHTPGRPALTIAASGTQWTFAHELGHLLLGKNFTPVHMTHDTTNIMHDYTWKITSDPPTLTISQLAAIKSSIYCRVCEDNMTRVDWDKGKPVPRAPRRNADFFFKQNYK